MNSPDPALFKNWTAGRRFGIVDQPAHRRLSRFVAASGAFPGALTAVQEALDVRIVADPRGIARQGTGAYDEVLLADGGISDNSALTFLADASTKSARWRPELIVSSDAGVVFGRRDSIEPVEEFGRALDVVYANATPSEMSLAGPPMLLLSPAQFGEPPDRFQMGRWITIWPFIDRALEDDRAARHLRAVLDGLTAEQSRAARGPNELMVRERIGEVLVRGLETFSRTSTLKDQFSPTDARDLFALGQLLVFLNMSHLENQLAALK